ncbi:MAG TPA: hypothetical protein VKK79_03130 [Candidatus Lokiarchaeia archaeon]|nr:hypothetical protein [Candidatus Lokiarchaeia archaeon]
MVQIFVVEPTGETKELGIGGDQCVKEFLNTNDVFIITDDDTKKVWLWKGKESRIRSKFIGAKKSQEVRGQVGLSFKVEPVDEGEEPEDFPPCLEQIPKPGYAKEIREEGEGPKFLKDMDFSKPEEIPTEPIKSAGTPGAPAPKKKGAKAAKPSPLEAAYATSAENVGPIFTGGGEEAIAAKPQASVPAADYTKILETLSSLDTPAGYEREMVIVGSQTFSIVEKATTFLGQRVVKKEMEPIGSLPEGVFFAEGYAPRVLCENGKVLAIEFLKKVTGATSRAPAVARSGQKATNASTPALGAASAKQTPAIPGVRAKPLPPPPKLPKVTAAPEPGVEVFGEAEEVPHETLKSHLAKKGMKDPLKAFGFRIGKKNESEENPPEE